MAYHREQEAYELTPGPGTAHSGAASPPIVAADAAARRPSELSREIMDDTNSDDPISDDHAKSKEKEAKAQQPGMGDYFVRKLIGVERYLDMVKLTRARKYSASVIAWTSSCT